MRAFCCLLFGSSCCLLTMFASPLVFFQPRGNLRDTGGSSRQPRAIHPPLRKDRKSGPNRPGYPSAGWCVLWLTFVMSPPKHNQRALREWAFVACHDVLSVIVVARSHSSCTPKPCPACFTHAPSSHQPSFRLRVGNSVEAERFFLSEVSDLPLTAEPGLEEGTDQQSRVAAALNNSDMRYYAAEAYRAWLGYYNGSLKKLKWTKADLAKAGSKYAKTIGLDTAPPLAPRLAGKMGLRNAPGIEVREAEKGPKPLASPALRASTAQFHNTSGANHKGGGGAQASAEQVAVLKAIQSTVVDQPKMAHQTAATWFPRATPLFLRPSKAPTTRGTCTKRRGRKNELVLRLELFGWEGLRKYENSQLGSALFRPFRARPRGGCRICKLVHS